MTEYDGPERGRPFENRIYVGTPKIAERLGLTMNQTQYWIRINRIPHWKTDTTKSKSQPVTSERLIQKWLEEQEAEALSATPGPEAA